MSTYNETMIASDEVCDYFSAVLSKLDGIVDLDLDSDEFISFERPNFLPKSEQYNDLRVLFAKHCDSLFGPTRFIYEDAFCLGIAVLYMAMGAPIPDSFKDECLAIADDCDLSAWSYPLRRKALLGSFSDALRSYDGVTPLFEVDHVLFTNTGTGMAGHPWVTSENIPK